MEQHLIQPSCGYVFRMLISNDLRQAMGKREPRESSDECSLLNAKRKAKRISTKVNGLFARL